jgi:hypothetical protein
MSVAIRSAAILVVLLATAARVRAQAAPVTDSARGAAQGPATPTAWYQRISLRGYTQVRYNRLLETNEALNCPQCDRSIGRNGGYFIRRGRLIFSGDVHPRVSIYIQPDFASDATEQSLYLQIRDAYFDLALNDSRSHRLRFGQSKLPWGFENMQSSSNRIPLDRNDALNSAVPNERDMGVFYYYASPEARRRFAQLVSSGLKGSGDYGVFGIGLYNGQGASRPELNDDLHAVARLTYPWRLPNGQFVEASVQAYKGQVVLPTVAAGVARDPEYLDQRQAVTFVWYAQPLGIVSEYTWGHGPEYDPAANRVRRAPLQGGFVQTMYRWQPGAQVVQPFARYQAYDGGKKLEQDARHYRVRETEIGVEWLPFPAFELTAMYTISDRLFEDLATEGNRQKGRLLRLQAQFNY